MADDDGKKIELRVGSAGDSGPGQAGANSAGGHAHTGSGPGLGPQGGYTQAPKPVMGWIAVACGILGIFTYGVVFVPIAFVCSIIALFMGQGMWAFLGFLTAFVGLMTSPLLLTILGLGAMFAYFGIPMP